MKKHIHGGNVYQYENCIDFSANCNPLGTPESVKEAIIQSLASISDYPQVGCTRLKEAIGTYEEIPAEYLICGNGAAEVIFSLCRALSPKRALLPAPTFAEYEQALRSVGCEISHYHLREDRSFQLSEVFLQNLDENIDILFLCNPNNPTGTLIEKELLLKTLKRCSELDIFLVVDECFLDFVKNPGHYTLKEEISAYKNLFLLKAFTKRYAMAGVRLGYGITSNTELLDHMELMNQPWNVSTIAQAAGIAALKEREYVEAGRRLIFKEKEYLLEQMQQLGLKTYPSKANYIFFGGPDTLFDDCVQQGILIRDCSNYEGLEKGYYRIAVKQHEDNVKLVKALNHVLKAQNHY